MGIVGEGVSNDRFSSKGIRMGKDDSSEPLALAESQKEGYDG